MRKYFYFIVFLSFYLNFLTAQTSIQNLVNAKTIKLDNGLSIIHVPTGDTNYTYYSIFVNINPAVEPVPKTSDVIATILGFDKSSDLLLIGKRISTPKVIDTMLRFFRNYFLDKKITQKQLDFGKGIVINQYANARTSLAEHENYAKIFTFGSKSVFARQFSKDKLQYLDLQDLQKTYSTFFTPQAITIVIVSNQKSDSVFSICRQIFGDWRKKTELQPPLQQLYQPITQVHIIRSNLNYISFSYPVRFFYNDPDFIEKQIAIELFKQKFKNEARRFFDFYQIKIPMQAVGSQMYIFGKFKPDSLEFSVEKTISLLRDMLIYSPSNDELIKAKNALKTRFNRTVENPYQLAYYAYLSDYYHIDKFFFTSYNQNVEKVKSSDLQRVASQIFKPSSTAIVMQTDPKNTICQLTDLAEFYKINFYDNKMFKYKIIPKGFNASYIEKSFLSACNYSKYPQNLKINFDIFFKADTTYTGQGVLLKKHHFFKLQTNLFLPFDTINQTTIIVTPRKAYIKNALGEKYTSPDSILPNLFFYSLFAETYYHSQDYKRLIKCNKKEMNNNIYRIKAFNSNSGYVLNFYDMNKRKKTQTQYHKFINGEDSIVLIVNYADYKEIAGGLTIPYLIVEKYANFLLKVKIKNVETDEKLKNKDFKIPLHR